MTNPLNISSEVLMERVKRSDQEAFNMLYDRFWEQMYIKALSILGDRNTAKDIVQEIWISVWERRNIIDNNNIEGYLFRAVRFKVYNEFRNVKYRDKLIEEFVQNHNAQISTNNIEENMQLKDTETIIFSAVNGLPKKCKQVFELSRFEGLKNNEIADKLNISQRTVETHISNALKVLKKHTILLFLLFNFL